MKLTKKRVMNTLHTCLFIFLGNGILAFLVAAFIIPHDIIVGGTTGIGIVLSELLHMDTAMMVLILNIILLIFGGFVLGKKFFLTTVASSVLYPIMLALIQRIPGIETLTDNTLLASIFAGGLLGIALGLVMRVGSSTGGLDVVDLVINKWFHVPISICVYVTDLIVIGGQAIFSTPEKLLYAIIVLALESFALDQVMIFGQSQIQIFAVSDKYEEIRRRILAELQAGATMVNIETGCLGNKQQGVLCVIPPRKLYAAKELIQSIDADVFITVTQIKEVRGRGFTMERKDYNLPENEGKTK
ncbi:MAG: YitT family protein [Oscillospiraceae bacterium]